MKEDPRMTDGVFAFYNQEFRHACNLAGVKPTTRQAGRFRRGKGAAFKALKKQEAEKQTT